MRREFLFEAGRHFASCHAATLVDLPDGDLLCAWFAGTYEGHPDVAIWMARYHADSWEWSVPQIVADAPETPLWNPVLFRDTQDVLWLFYKIAPSIPAWTGAYLRSSDHGRTWSAPSYLPAGLLGPIKNKPITLSNGDILCPTSSESWMQWACWVEISADGGCSWSKHGPISALHTRSQGTASVDEGLISATWDAPQSALLLPQHIRGVIQPAAWEWAPGRVEMLMRATTDIGVICRASSMDYGHTWGPLQRTNIPNPNSGLDVARLSGGATAEGSLVLACNPVKEGRTPLALLISRDNGDTWPLRVDLETAPGEYSYPSIIQATDGRVHCVYTYRRERIAHVSFTATELDR